MQGIHVCCVVIAAFLPTATHMPYSCNPNRPCALYCLLPIPFNPSCAYAMTLPPPPQVKFPLQGLDLSSYVLGGQGRTDPSQAPLYDCYAVSNHYGGLGGGHYTAYAQMPDDSKWYLFDDSRVEPVNNAEAVSMVGGGWVGGGWGAGWGGGQ
jgi:hypothetical protein